MYTSLGLSSTMISQLLTKLLTTVALQSPGPMNKTAGLQRVSTEILTYFGTLIIRRACVGLSDSTAEKTRKVHAVLYYQEQICCSLGIAYTQHCPSSAFKASHAKSIVRGES
jgi:hypothetical protein